MFIRSMRLTAPTVCTAGLLAVLMTVGAPSIASDNQSRTETQDQSEIAEMTLGQGFIDFGLNINAEKSILRISGPAGYALTLRNQKPAAVTADLLMDAKPPRGADESPSIPKVWQNLPDGTYLYELVLIQGDGSQEVKNGTFKVVNGQPLSNDENAQPADSGDGHSSTYEPNWIERVASATLDFLVPSAHADTASNFIDVFDDSNDNNTDITLHNDSSSNVAMFNESGQLKFGTGTAGTDDVLMTFSAINGKVGLHTEAPQELLHIVAPQSGNTANIKIENSDNAFTLATGSTTGFRIRQTEPGSTTVFQIEPGAPSGSFSINSSGNISTASGISAGGNIEAIGGMTITSGTPSITFDNTTGNNVNWTIAENSDDLRITQSGGTGPSTPFVIQDNGTVGIGTTTPSAPLHVSRTDGTAEILLEETQAIDINQQFTMVSNGNTGFQFDNTRDSSTWQFRTGGASGNSDAFIITQVGTGKSELNLNENGNLTIAGQLFTGSSRSTKTNISTVDAESLIKRLEELSLHEWSYKGNSDQVHIGPMAEDFHKVFGYGGRPDKIAPSDLASLSLLAAQELIKQNRELESRIMQLEHQYSSSTR